MAFFIPRRLIDNLLTSPRSSSLSLPSLPSATISKPSAQLYLLHVSSSSNPSHPTQKPQILEPNFLRSAPFATFRPSKPTFSPANDNRETPYSGQIPSSIQSSLLENKLRDSLRKSVENIRGLKSAWTVVGLAHTGIGAWIAGSLPFYPNFLTQVFLASAVPLLFASAMKESSQGISSLNMKTERGLFLISKLASLTASVVFVVTIALLLVQLCIYFLIPHDLLMILRIKISTITMTLFPAVWYSDILDDIGEP